MAKELDIDYHSLNAMVNLYDTEGKLQLDKDKEAARQYFLQHINKNMHWFHSLEEKIHFLVENGYWASEVIDKYSPEDLKSLFKYAYSFKFRFTSFLGAYKFYSSYAMKNNDGDRYLERFEDRVTMVAASLAEGDVALARSYVEEIIQGRYQPATPTFSNAGKRRSGEQVSCFLLDVDDNLESIMRTLTNSAQLSKIGGGVGINISNIRGKGDPIKEYKNQSSGVVPLMKQLDDLSRYIDQLGNRAGAFAVYINALHFDILDALDTKRENADENVRIKSLSIGVVVPDIVFELAKNNEDMYLFSPYDVEREYGVVFSDVDKTAEYRNMVDNPNIRKKKTNARKFFQYLSEIQFESGYPYIMFEDTVNRANPVNGKISYSNLCSEILQVRTPSQFNEAGEYLEVGRDISCNLGSMDVARLVKSEDFGKSVGTAIRALTAVSDQSNIATVPTVKKANEDYHSVGLGHMNLHGFLMEAGVAYGSPEALNFVEHYFRAVAYYGLRESNKIAQERGEKFYEFDKSKYADGTFFVKIHQDKVEPNEFTSSVLGDIIPSDEDWRELERSIKENGLYHSYLFATAPTGSISYVKHSTASIHPVPSKLEIRKEGKIGRVYYPQYGLNQDNFEDYEDAYDLGYEKVIDTYATAQKYVDQGMSLTLFFKDTATTRDLDRARMYAWRKGIKTIYYIRLRQQALAGTEVEGCVSCTV